MPSILFLLLFMYISISIKISLCISYISVKRHKQEFYRTYVQGSNHEVISFFKEADSIPMSINYMIYVCSPFLTHLVTANA